jgi:hypothetical protein
MRRVLGLIGSAAAVLAHQFACEDRRNAVSAFDLGKKVKPTGPPMTRAQIARADHGDLVRASQQQIVLGHIHPRWLRAEVERRLDRGEDIDAERIEQLRAMGPGHA